MKLRLEELHQQKQEANRKQTSLEEAKKLKAILSDERQQTELELSPIHQKLKEIKELEKDLNHIQGDLSM